MELSRVNGKVAIVGTTAEQKLATSVNMKKESVKESVEKSAVSFMKNKGVVSSEELETILSTISAASSDYDDVNKASQMIQASNKNILREKNQSVLAQANQERPVVEELTK